MCLHKHPNMKYTETLKLYKKKNKKTVVCVSPKLFYCLFATKKTHHVPCVCFRLPSYAIAVLCS